MLLLLLSLPFVAALVAACMPSGSRHRPAAVGAIATGAALLLAILQFGRIADGEVPRQQFDWLPELGLTLVLRMDGLALSLIHI